MKRVLFFSATYYNLPLSENLKKKFQFLSEVSECTVLAFSNKNIEFQEEILVVDVLAKHGFVARIVDIFIAVDRANRVLALLHEMPSVNCVIRPNTLNFWMTSCSRFVAVSPFDKYVDRSICGAFDKVAESEECGNVRRPCPVEQRRREAMMAQIS